MSVVLLDDGIVHYEVLGRGRPVIFLHGWVGSWRYWISSMQVTSTSFRAYALDLWGFGDTAHKKERYSVKKQTELVRLFLDEMGIGKIALVGHGLGALVALDFASTHKEIVDRIMLTNCSLDMEKINPKLFSDSPEKLASWLSNGFSTTETALADAKKTDKDAIQASRNISEVPQLFNTVNRQHTPCLLVSGARDELIGQPSLNQLSVLSELSHHILLEEAGYFPMLDTATTFNRLLTDFLALDSGLGVKQLNLKEEWRRRVR
ncbi:MAG: alpha/beta hydrolase [Anaerolineae bacterium]|jgi:pimeloyl-ACP methyl ester carboxylesterase|nr:alpha/beta hydrolase [Anaerolineae bacterium]MBT7075731.1 alpha/beta hydrolase [Anaerolineae bacterium]MBT7782632.1 alpha/beta hydrolase [Anaerolineae bacterium]